MINSYYDLTIKQFLKCKTIADLEQDPLNRNIKLLAEITGKSVDEIEELPISELQSKLSGLSNIETLEPNAKVNMKIKIGGKRFQVIWQTQHLTAYQYIDATSFCKDPINNIHNILAAITVERDILGRLKKYNGDKHKERAELFYNNMKIKDAYPIMVFFCKYLEELHNNTQTYLTQEMQKMSNLLSKKKTLTQDGDGLLH